MKHDRLINFRVPDKDYEVWKEEAYRQRKSFARWARETLDAAVQPGDARAVELRTPVHEVKTNVVAIAEQLRTKAAQKAQCEKRLPKGAFCKSCGRIHK